MSDETQRKRATKKERLTPCQVCLWPLSQRHHLLPIAEYGENDTTVQLCANCHEIYHLIYNHYVLGSKNLLLGHVLVKLGFINQTISELYQLVERARELDRVMTAQAIAMVTK